MYRKVAPICPPCIHVKANEIFGGRGRIIDSELWAYAHPAPPISAAWFLTLNLATLWWRLPSLRQRSSAGQTLSEAIIIYSSLFGLVVIGKQLLVCWEKDNAHDRHMVSIKIGGGALVEHVLWDISCVFHCVQSSLYSGGRQMTCHILCMKGGQSSN